MDQYNRLIHLREDSLFTIILMIEDIFKDGINMESNT